MAVSQDPPYLCVCLSYVCTQRPLPSHFSLSVNILLPVLIYLTSEGQSVGLSQETRTFIGLEMLPVSALGTVMERQLSPKYLSQRLLRQSVNNLIVS